MSVTINAKYPINEETSLLTLKERWKADYKTLLHIPLCQDSCHP